MCTGKCAKCIGISLFPFCLVSIVVNVILLFPGWDTEPVQHASEQLTIEVVYLGGVVGGGLLVLIPAIHIQATGREGCCNNRCGMFLSILFAAVGAVGSLYGFVASVLGMVRGPQCLFNNGTSLVWGRPFNENITGLTDIKDFNDESYLFHKDVWDICTKPKGVVEFNIILFSMLLTSCAISMILCIIQMVNGLFGCLCGTCLKNKD
ncbi:hypothetical protein GDO78_022014 [Eleutherodactylus coqui]|uniref:Uncharacterized protein n=1 Tax=Eleutherodactylus coqui TaxID=57060 RepID=A0A8J6BIH2_ELECQ|nr:hypothetical protein GDO78_022014 [Eleutherodactylus coqui]